MPAGSPTPRRLRPAGADARPGPATLSGPLSTAPVETTAPVTSDPALDGDHERMSHIVLEGFKPEEGDFVSTGPTVVEGMVNGTPVRALCGKVWVPGRDPRRYPLCPTCKEIAQGMGWRVPAG